MMHESHKLLYNVKEANLSEELELVETSECCENGFVSIKDSGSIVWTICVETEGRYEFFIKYRSFFGDRAQQLIINGKEWAIGFSYSFGRWNEVKWISRLNSGTNTIELKSYSSYYGYIDVAALRLGTFHSMNEEPVYEIPTVSPIKNIYYKESPRDIEIRLNCSGHRLISIACNEEKVDYNEENYPYVEDSKIITVPGDYLGRLSEGTHKFELNFEDGAVIVYPIDIIGCTDRAPLTITALDVRHGYSTFFILPDGRTVLVDSGDDNRARDRVMPFLDKHGFNKLDYYVITHYHEDHCGAREEILEKYKVDKFYDYKDFKAGQEFELAGMKIKILNSYYDHDTDENSRSLCFRLEYKGFTYVHGGDIYGSDQARIMKRFPDCVRAHVYNANHHFHGSIDVNYLRKTDPYLILLSAEEAVYARGAYAHHYKENVAKYLKANNGRLLEDLLTLEVGNTVIRVHDKDNWTYETYKDMGKCIVPYLK